MKFIWRKRFKVAGWLICCLCASALLAGCSSPTKTVRMKIHSEPEGAYIVYKVTGPEVPCAGEWIYLGNTPFRGVHQFDKERLEDAGKITIKVMRQGYTDQIIEWDGPGFWEEAEEKGVIFWTPELIPENKN
jgi:hypothetical protein